MNLNVQINMPDDQERPHRLARWAGIWKDHPDIDAYLANIEEYRRNVDARGVVDINESDEDVAPDRVT